MAEKNVSLPATSTSSDSSASEDSWTFLDDIDDVQTVNSNIGSIPLTTATDENDRPIENATEAVALNGETALDAATVQSEDDNSGVETQR